jgi:phosphotransferase family enzyme
MPAQNECLDPVAIEPFQGLLKIHTPDGLFFFKPFRSIHKHEQKLTCLLAKLYPFRLPEVIGADDEKGWLLMRDVGGDLFDDIYDIKHFEGAISNFAQLQIECIKHTAVLLASGCSDYQLGSIALGIESIFEHVSHLESNNNDEVNDIRKRIDFPTLIERLAERCEQVKEENIPPTLCHGDLNLGNIFTKHDQYVFIDWAEGYVGYPFFSPLEYFNIVKRFRGSEMINLPALRAAYLKPWSKTLELDTSHLVKLLDLSRPLGMLRIVMRLWQDYMSLKAIRPNTEIPATHVTRIWNLIQRMNNILSRD